MTSRSNTFEGQPSGTAWTPANSGGGSGDAWDNTSQSGTVTAVYDSAQAANGAQSLHVTGAASSQHIMRWTGLSGPALTARFYLRLVAASGAQDISQWRNSGTQAAALGLSSSRQLQVKTASGSAARTSTALALDTWYRIEGRPVRGSSSTDGAFACAYFLGESETPVEVLTTSGIDLGTADLVQWSLGKLTSGPSLEAFFDGATVSDTALDLLGPYTRQAVRRSRLSRLPSRIG